MGFNNYKNMIDENNIFEYIKNSNFIEIQLKNNLINHFDKLNKNQIDKLIKYFNRQKNEILQMLMILKDKEICSFEEIKTNLDLINKNLIKNEELKAEKQDEENILNLLEEIY